MTIRLFHVKAVKCLGVFRGFCTLASRHNVRISHAVYPERSKLDSATTTPIFITHGLFGCKKNWHSLAKLIASSTNRMVVTLDARNHGDSEHTPVMNYLLMRDDLLGVMDRLKVERPILLGHSMGGKTAMACALSHPERLSSLIVVDVAPQPSPGVETLKMYAQKMKEVKIPIGVSFLEARRQIMKQLQPFVKSMGELTFLMTNLRENNNSISWQVNLDAVIANIEDIGNFPQFDTTCNVKTIFIGGSLSRHLDESSLQCVKRLFPGATVEHIFAAGHWVHSEKPQEFVAAVTDFIRNVHTDN